MAKRVTLSEIGQKAGVSDVAVSAALGLLSESSSVRLGKEKADAIRKIATEMGYQPNLLARAFRNKSTRMIGVLFRVVSNPVSVSYLIDCMHRELLARDYHAYLSPFQSSFPVLEENLKTLMAWQVDGIILSHVFQTDDKLGHWPGLESMLDKAKVPIVLIESDLKTLAPRPRVNADLTHAMEIATRHLIELGHRKIAFVADHRGVTPDRWQGVQKALAACPAAKVSQIALEFDLSQPRIQQWTLAGQALGRKIAGMAKRPTGLLCNNDMIAASVVAGLLDAGLSVPGDISVSGYDDSEHAVLCRPNLTSFSPPIEQMAKVGVQLLLDQVESKKSEPRVERFEPIITRRASTGPAPKLT